jgi:hypothetical protein
VKWLNLIERHQTSGHSTWLKKMFMGEISYKIAKKMFVTPKKQLTKKGLSAREYNGTTTQLSLSSFFLSLKERRREKTDKLEKKTQKRLLLKQ